MIKAMSVQGIQIGDTTHTHAQVIILQSFNATNIKVNTTTNDIALPIRICFLFIDVCLLYN